MEVNVVIFHNIYNPPQARCPKDLLLTISENSD